MTKDLTQGKITPLLVKFTIPLLFGNIFQLMYNSVDSIIVGQLVGKEALAAVGTSNPLMTLAILFVNGMCIGASILMGTQYGAKKMDVLKRQISTTMIAGIVFSIAVTLFCILFARPLLLLIRVQEEVLPLAVSYLRIVFLGFIFTFIYNFFACTLRALGDSTTPLYFLVASSVLISSGIWFFVAVLRWGQHGLCGRNGVSEAVCCMLCIIYIKRKVTGVKSWKSMVCIRWIAAETDDPLWMDECDAAGNRTAWKNRRAGNCQHNGSFRDGGVYDREPH